MWGHAKLAMRLCVIVMGLTATFDLGADGSHTSSASNGRRPSKLKDGPPPRVGHRIYPLRSFNVAEGEWEAIVYIFDQDYYRISDVVPSNCRRTTDKKQIAALVKNLDLVYTGLDRGTTMSSFFLVKDGVIQYQAGIAVGEGEDGFQTRDFGWAREYRQGQLLNYVKSFRSACPKSLESRYSDGSVKLAPK